MANYIFELRDKVRDYECDLQGICSHRSTSLPSRRTGCSSLLFDHDKAPVDSR